MASKMTCKNSPKTFYTGKEMSPLGVGFCADVEKVGVKMTGKDNKEWVVGLKKGNKLWIRSKDEPKEPEPEPEESDKEEESDKASESGSDSDKEEEEPAPKPAPKAKKEKAPAKKEKAPAKKQKEESTESEEEEPKPVPKAKAKKEPKSAIDKMLEAHGIDGKAAEDIKALFMKKVKKSKDDEDKPKRAPSTYNKFVSFKLTELRKEKPDLPAKEYMALAGAQWKLLNDEEKKSFA